MKSRCTSLFLILTASSIAPLSIHAATGDLNPENWHAKSLLEALALTALFSFIGIAFAIVGYKLFDKCTPGNLHKEIVENKNVAAALIGAAVIIGVCIVVAAAIIG